MRSSSGFTLIELLVAIVVIAVLAAISVVSYSSIQQRAREAAVLSSLSTIGKKLTLHEIQTGDAINRSTAKTIIAEAHRSTPGNNDYVVCLNSTAGSYAVVSYEPLKPAANGSDLLHYTNSPSGAVQSKTYTSTHGTLSGTICNAALPGWNGAYWYSAL